MMPRRKNSQVIWNVSRTTVICNMKNVTDKGKVAQLLCVSIGSLHYNNLAAFLGPEKPVNKLNLVDLISCFKKLLIPKKNVVVSQHYFLNVFQKDHQNIADFVSSLQRDIVDCEFNVKCVCQKSVSVSDIFLRAQFIRGLRDDWLREQILQSDKTTFEDILVKATALEASKIESKELKQGVDRAPGVNIAILLLHVTSHKSYSRRSSNSRHVNFRALGIENCCLRCGRNNHKASDCRTDRTQLKCHSCNKQGHVAKVCISTLRSRDKSTNHDTNSVETEDYSDYSTATYGVNKLESIQQQVVDLFEVSDSDKYLIDVTLNGKVQQFEVDSGAKFSLLSQNEFQSLNLNLPIEESHVAFRSYSGDIIKPVGKLRLKVAYAGKEIIGELHIVPNGHDALLGRQWIRGLGIELKKIDSNSTNLAPTLQVQNNKISIDDVLGQFSPIFEEKVGCVPDFQVSLQLREGAKPIFTRERDVPYALQERVDKELDSLEADGIITQVAASDWGSPLVVIPKPDGGVRLCVDYKCGVNERLVQANHPIRRIDDVLHSLRNSRYFCKLDLYKAYLHLKVDEESSTIQTISTHRGTFRMNRLSFGIKTAPSDFNRILCQILKGLQGVEAYFDDIIIHGSTREQCLQNLVACLQKLTRYNLHVNKNKCSFLSEKIEYLGHVVEFNKISKSPVKVRAIQEMTSPSNPEQVKQFMGLVTYYSRFIPDFSTMSYPLRCLLKKNHKWFWSSNCESAFLKLKSELCSDRVLMPFNPSLPVSLTTDASPYGVGAVLSHTVNGVEKPIAYASRSLTTSEQNYSQLDREALAIIFGVTHFYKYLFGRHFLLITDNQPLSRILHPYKALPQMTSARLLRYASFLSGFNYSVQFKRGELNQNADCLSRAPVQPHQISHDQLIGNEVNQLCAETIFQISSKYITSQVIQEETEKDSELRNIIQDLKNNSTDSEFTLVDGIIFRKDRVLIPSSLRSTVLNELHETHLGITKMKQLARRYVYWFHIDKDIERLVRSCQNCALTRSNPPQVPVHPWDSPQDNWERLHIDYAGPFENHYFLVCVDAKSKWAEVKIIKDAPNSSNTINLLENIFSVHGYPQVMVSDNASIFQSEEFHAYCSNHGIFQKFIAPGHPATNGLAERNVQTLKHRLKAVSNERMSMQMKVQNILLRYRATPLSCGKSPAELYLNRKLRIRMDAIFPYRPQTSTFKT
ncbi:hypothetical protein M8J77_007169 [Diaphorina citri]|nr:hypothetical protein M8J77_007169 [Diaphorina citri]